MEGPTMPKSVHSPQSLTDCILTQPQPLRQPLVDFLDLVLSSLSSHAVLQAPDSFLPFLLASFQKSMVKGGKSFFCLGVAWRLPWGAWLVVLFATGGFVKEKPSHTEDRSGSNSWELLVIIRN